MITTGIHLPPTSLTRLTTAVARIRRDAGDMTVDELRRRETQGSEGALLCLFTATFTNAGGIKTVSGRPTKHPCEPAAAERFVVPVRMFGTAGHAAVPIAITMAELLIRGEVDDRRRRGFRELIRMSDDELVEARAGLDSLRARAGWHSRDCGEVSERFQLALIDQEIEARKGESNHARLARISACAEELERCGRRLEAERIAAIEWAERRRARGLDPFYAKLWFDDRPEEEQIVIAHRTARGW